MDARGLGMFWAYLYAPMEVTTPDSFRVLRGTATEWTDARSRRAGFNRLFIFSYATLTGTGRGDLEPANGFADMASSLEAMSAQVYLAVVVARLVGMQAGSPTAVRPEGSPDDRAIGRDLSD